MKKGSRIHQIYNTKYVFLQISPQKTTFFSCGKWNWRVVFTVVEKLKEQQKITSEIVAENFTPAWIFHATYFVARANKNYKRILAFTRGKARLS